jgi:hypothetical protein
LLGVVVSLLGPLAADGGAGEGGEALWRKAARPPVRLDGNEALWVSVEPEMQNAGGRGLTTIFLVYN